MKPVIQAIIFDMDGVLTDSEPLINAAAVAMFRERGLIVQPEAFISFVGTAGDCYFSRMVSMHSVLAMGRPSTASTWIVSPSGMGLNPARIGWQGETGEKCPTPRR